MLFVLNILARVLLVLKLAGPLQDTLPFSPLGFTRIV